MKKLFITILAILFVGFFCSTVVGEIAPNWVDRYEMPKESMVDPFIRGDDCRIDHKEALN